MLKQHISFLFLKVHFHFSLKDKGVERFREKEIFHLPIHSPMPATVLAEPCQSQEPRTESGMARTQTLDPSFVDSQRTHEQEVASKIEKPGLKSWHCDVGCRCFRWQLNSLCQMPSPRELSLLGRYLGWNYLLAKCSTSSWGDIVKSPED